MYQFEYLRPTTLDEAGAFLRDRDDAQILAGGQTLIPVMKQRLASPGALIDLKGLPKLDLIATDSEGLEIGALATHAAVAASPLVRRAIPAIADLAGGIGDPQVRNRGTLGGSIANNDPAADYPTALLALGATISTSEREIAADDFFTGQFETDLVPGEIVTSVRFPIPHRAAYVKFPNPASRFAIVGAFAVLTAGGARVAVTGAAPCVFRWTEAEQRLSHSFTSGALDGIAMRATRLNSDLHADPAYRAHLVAVMTRRAVGKALS
jgi:aerobic carbon-monoxide dehydrogenase medium subunit